MSRNAPLGLIIIFGLGLVVSGAARAQNVRPDAPDISVLYWYNKTNPQGTIKFQVYEGSYPQGPVRDWMARSKINDINSNLRGCPYDAPFRIQLSRYPGYRNGTMTKEDIVRAVKEQVTRNLPAPELPFQRIPTVDVRPIQQPRQESGTTRFTYKEDAGNLVGTTWAERANRGVDGEVITFGQGGRAASRLRSGPSYLEYKWRSDGNKVYLSQKVDSYNRGVYYAPEEEVTRNGNTLFRFNKQAYYDKQ